jgi:hypothetical protein
MQITETATMPQEHPLMTAVFPRFTPQEAIILNMIVSASPYAVSTEEIRRKIIQTMQPGPWGDPTRNAIQIMICNIRAKIGERKWHQTRLISVYADSVGRGRGKLVGYRWRG